MSTCPKGGFSKKLTRAGNLTHRYFAKIDSVFLTICKKLGLKPTRARARRFRQRDGISRGTKVV